MEASDRLPELETESARIRWVTPQIQEITYGTAFSDEDLRSYFATLDAGLSRGVPYVAILTTNTPRPSMKQRKAQAEWLGDRKAELERLCIGAAFVLPSPVGRLVLSSILLIQRLPVPYVVLDDMDQALAWAHERVTEATASRAHGS